MTRYQILYITQHTEEGPDVADFHKNIKPTGNFWWRGCFTQPWSFFSFCNHGSCSCSDKANVGVYVVSSFLIDGIIVLHSWTSLRTNHQVTADTQDRETLSFFSHMWQLTFSPRCTVLWPHHKRPSLRYVARHSTEMKHSNHRGQRNNAFLPHKVKGTVTF